MGITRRQFIGAQNFCGNSPRVPKTTRSTIGGELTKRLCKCGRRPLGSQERVGKAKRSVGWHLTRKEEWDGAATVPVVRAKKPSAKRGRLACGVMLWV